MSKDQASRYTQSGVDDLAAAATVASINATLARTGSKLNLLGQDGAGFASALALPAGYREPVLVSSCDGIGTKIMLLADTNQLAIAGHDLVAACVNDVICHGATPWYMLDHISCEKLDPTAVKQIVTGITDACALAKLELVGGELAQLPGTLSDGAYELSGHVVGIAEKTKLLHAGKVETGDTLLAFASSGPHCNGFSLVRSILKDTGASLDELIGERTVGEALLAPSYIYVDAIAALACVASGLHACAHITGGGLERNLARIMPEGKKVQIDQASWEIPPLYSWLAEQGKVDMAEMSKVFNCGIGMVVAVAQQDAEAALAALTAQEFAVWQLGEVGQA